MGKIAKRATALACAVMLALGMTPAAAFAEAGLKAGSANADSLGRQGAPAATMEQRAEQIDAHAGAFSDEGIIVVYRKGAPAGKRAVSGLSTQSVSVAGIPDATAELLSADSGIAGGGAAVHVDLPVGISVGQAVAAAQADPDVVHAQPIFRYKLLTLPNDPVLGNTAISDIDPNQWWIPAVNAEEAWDTVHSDHKVSVAVLDTGINFEHPDLANNILADYAYDAYNDAALTESPLSSEMAHGSHVAGIVAAEADNGVGIAGVSYNANIVPICVFHEEESYEGSRATCDDEDLIRAYDYLLSDKDENGLSVAQETNTHVVNMSLGGYLADDPSYEYDYAFEAKIEQAQDAGILTVAAAGNGDDYGNGRADASYPSDYKAVMSVIALADETTRTPWSDYNEDKNISAPGQDIYSTWYYDDKYQFSSGTSMASPIVAGCAALLWAYDPDLSVEDVKQALYSTADDLGESGFDARYGWGRVNVGAALRSIGTASVKGERATMVRTTSQRMRAADLANPGQTHSWKWSVRDPETGGPSSIARIDDEGVLVAIGVGTVEVCVESTDAVTPVAGHRTIEIADISIPGDVVASANPGENTIALRWAPAEAAVGYRVLRAESEEGPFEALAEVAADEALGETDTSEIGYLDQTAKPSVAYWYRVIALGQFEGAGIEGRASASNRCYYTDKSALKRAIASAEKMLANTKSSVDGADVNSDEQWTAGAQRAALNQVLSRAYNAFYSGSLLQEAVDERTAQLLEALGVFESARQPGKLVVAPAKPADQGPSDGASTSTTGATAPTGAVSPTTSSSANKTGSGSSGASTAKPSTTTSSSGSATASSGTAKTSSSSKAASGASTQKKTSQAGKSAGSSKSSAKTTKAAKTTTKAKATKKVAKKRANTLRVTSKASKKPIVVKYSKTKARTIKKAKAFKVAGAKGKVTFAKASGNKKITVSKAGKITVKKGLARGTYTVKVKVKAAGNNKYKAKTATVKVKVRVR